MQGSLGFCSSWGATNIRNGPLSDDHLEILSKKVIRIDLVKVRNINRIFGIE